MHAELLCEGLREIQAAKLSAAAREMVTSLLECSGAPSYEAQYTVFGKKLVTELESCFKTQRIGKLEREVTLHGMLSISFEHQLISRNCGLLLSTK